MATANGLKRLIVALSAAYRSEVDQATAATWARAVRDVDDDVLDEAVDAWIQNSTRFPRPAEIIQTADAVVRRRRDAVPALGEHEPTREELFPAYERGIKEAREAMRKATARGGVVKHVDDVLAEEARDG